MKTQELPHDLLSEKTLLACLIIDSGCFDQISDLSLAREDFYHPQHGIIFEAIKDLYVDSRPIDIVTLSARLQDSGKLEAIGGQKQLINICEEVASAANVESYGRIVKQKAVIREVIRTATRVIETGSGDISNVEEFLNDVEAGFFKLTNQTKAKKLVAIKEALIENLKELESPGRKPGEITGLTSGFKSVDRKLLGFQPGQLVILAARPGMGKTSLALNWAVNACKAHDLPVVIFSYEMLYAELSMRLLSSEACIDSRKLRTKDFSPTDLKDIASGIHRLSNLPIFINDSGSTNLLDIRSYSRKVKAERGLGMIVIDYLQLMQPHIRKNSREQEIAEISRGLKMLANELEIPIIALSQLNRSAASRSDRRPQLQDLRESGSLEQDSDIVCLIHREDAYDENTPKKGVAELIIAKNRAGEIGTVELSWIGSHTKFSELEVHRDHV